jgi:hypothetical protein
MQLSGKWTQGDPYPIRKGGAQPVLNTVKGETDGFRKRNTGKSKYFGVLYLLRGK